ncbi:unnamed protein product [Thlaspi arvense]|uniref:Protein kinase domain-containing protein n=1 Tax=Thlaspi arvense TaxID=13288 RepID=A0AAU9RWY7_THLAR|nr:unnamed protein product [Thlaspi arvense]
MQISNCRELGFLGLADTGISGQIPYSLGELQNLKTLSVYTANLTGEIPPEIGNCSAWRTYLFMEIKFLNQLNGIIPYELAECEKLQEIDLSHNFLTGSVPRALFNLKNLTKLLLISNELSKGLPAAIGNCTRLTRLFHWRNPFRDWRLCSARNCYLNANKLQGKIPTSFQFLVKLNVLDLSMNRITGTMPQKFGDLKSLNKLILSGNYITSTIPKSLGFLPDTKFFQDLPASYFLGNPKLCIDRSQCQKEKKSPKNLVVLIVLNMTVAIIMGCSGVVYRIETPSCQVIAVKKLWPIRTQGEIPEQDLFTAEVTTLGSIRHKNIVRLLGCCSNGKTRLLLFDYISNGSLGGLLHKKRIFLDWDARYKIVLGAARGLAYLHHDCFPPIVHCDIKANNILVGPQFEVFLADFGLAKLDSASECSRVSNTVAGSYGYIAPENVSSQQFFRAIREFSASEMAIIMFLRLTDRRRREWLDTLRDS